MVIIPQIPSKCRPPKGDKPMHNRRWCNRPSIFFLDDVLQLFPQFLDIRQLIWSLFSRALQELEASLGILLVELLFSGPLDQVETITEAVQNGLPFFTERKPHE